MKIKPKNLILDLLLANDGKPLSAREAIAACAVFGIRENHCRVALLRLSSDGLIEAAGRGVYQLSGSAHELADQVATWRSVEHRLRPWSGAYVAVHGGRLKRSDRLTMKNRVRALEMLGFRELDPGLYVRPDNLEDSVEALRQKLYSLGLERSASVFLVTDFDAERKARIAALWDTKALNESYRSLRQQLENWLTRAPALEPEVAMRESFLLGGKAIRQVVFDPMLPAPMVDTQARQTFINAVRRYDKAGQRIWNQSRAAADSATPVPPRRPKKR